MYKVNCTDDDILNKFKTVLRMVWLEKTLNRFVKMVNYSMNGLVRKLNTFRFVNFNND